MEVVEDMLLDKVYEMVQVRTGKLKERMSVFVDEHKSDYISSCLYIDNDQFNQILMRKNRITARIHK